MDSKANFHIILGASPNPSRASYIAAKKMDSHGLNWIPIGQNTVVVFGKQIIDINTKPIFTAVDTITLYPAVQQSYYDYILDLKPKRIIFNPGTENRELELLAKKQGIKTINACTLVMLSTGTYNIEAP
jgi:predicted CoA-binding protein